MEGLVGFMGSTAKPEGEEQIFYNHKYSKKPIPVIEE